MSKTWLKVLKQECKKGTQASVARKLGISSSTINRVLKGEYAGNMKNIQARVEGALMKITVDCPAVGMEIGRDLCCDNQRRKFAATNPQRVRLAQVCPTCESKTSGGEDEN